VNIDRMDDAAWASLAEFAPYAVGWICGWLLLWRLRPLPAPLLARDPVAVVVPARNEAESLPRLLPALLAATRPGDELVVVDDHSTDGTAEVATRLGATVTTPPDLPDGWLGKPHACWHGASSTSAPTLVFLDSDVQPRGDLLDRIAAAMAAHPGEVVSVQPHHVPGRATEQLSMLFNIVALMGVGRFSILGDRVRAKAAFGPVLAVDRATYDRVGGHAHPDVRAMHTEDIALARLVGAAQLYTGRPDVCFRMYPGGARELVRGWTRSVATGARSVPWWLTLATAAWVWSLAGGVFVNPWLHLSSALQVLVLARRAGRFSPLMAALYPLALAVFVLVFLRSAVAVVLRRDVVWKQRRVAAR
jgi:4,4'-diaponeurosporenoate glycosyltransferase